MGQIRTHVERNFHGHGLSRLVAAALEAEGFQVAVSPPGPDGGVDIRAGKGPMGFDSPRICVQVKSGRQVSGVSVLRDLQGVMQTFKADHGLLVSWGGFARPAEQEARSMHFNIRLWSSEQLLEAVFENYERLPAESGRSCPSSACGRWLKRTYSQGYAGILAEASAQHRRENEENLDALHRAMDSFNRAAD